jgi:PAS domain S-box-containing protein
MDFNKILIVNNDSKLNSQLLNILESNSLIPINSFEKGEDAVNYLKNENAELVILNTSLSGELNPFETAKLIQIQNNIPVIILTSEENKKNYRKINNNNLRFISKPLNSSELLNSIRELLSKNNDDFILKEAESKIDDLKKMNSIIINSLNQSVVIISAEGKIIFANDFALNEKFPVKNFINKNINELFPGTAGSKFLALIKNTLNSNLEHSISHIVKISAQQYLYNTRFVKYNENQVIAFFEEITKNADILKAFKESELKYKNLVNNSPFSITRLIIKTNKYEYVNEEFVKQSGYTLEDFNNLTLQQYKQMIHPDDREFILNEYSNWIKNGCVGVKNLVYRIFNKKNETLWLDSYHYADVLPDGSIEAINQIYLNISKQKRYEEILSESKQYLDAFFEQSLDGIFIAKLPEPVYWDREKLNTESLEYILKNIKIVRANKPLAEHFGVSLDEVYSISAELYYKDNLQNAKKRWIDFLNTGKSHIKEYFQKADGSLIYIEGDYYCLYDPNGYFIGYIGIQRDMTERKQADELLKLSEEKFRAVAEAIPAQVVIFQKDKFVYANPYSEIITGYKPDELLNMNFWDIVHDDFKDIVKQRGKARLNREDVPENYEMKIITKKGNVKWISYTGRFIKYNNKPAVIGISLDITENKKYEHEIKQSQERYKTFIEQSSEGIFRAECPNPIDINLPIDEQIKILFDECYYAEVNDCMARMYGLTKSDELAGKKVSDMLKLNEFNYQFMKKFILNGYRLHDDISREIDSSGNEIYISNNVVGIIEDQKLVRVWGTQKDITEKILMERKQLENSEYASIINYFTTSMLQQNTIDELLQDIVNNCFSRLSFVDCVIFLMDEQGKNVIQKARYGSSVFDNTQFNRIVIPLGSGIVGTVAKTGKPILINDTSQSDLYIPEQEVMQSELAVPILNDGKVIGVIDSEHPEKNFFTEFHLNILQSIASLCSNKIVQTLTQEKIKQSEERYRAFIQFSNEGIYRVELEIPFDINLPAEKQAELMFKYCKIIECNTVMAKMYGYNFPEEVQGKYIREMLNPDDKNNWDYTMRFIKNGYKIENEISYETDKFGNQIYFSNNAVGIVVNNKLVRIWGTQTDITKQKMQEIAIKNSLIEKEILLKEIHHRVKNNLQIVTSLLKLQAGYVDDENVKMLFKESQNRVHSMSLIHQKLYQTKDLSNIDFKEYIDTVTTHLQHSYGVLDDKVKIVTDSANINMSIDNAIPAGLIINELVSNSLKHAFPEGRKGHIYINTAFDEYKKEYWLTVRDDGIGLKEDPQTLMTKSFGLKLVYTLVNQLGGVIEPVLLNGTEFRIHFVSAEYRERNLY